MSKVEQMFLFVVCVGFPICKYYPNQLISGSDTLSSCPDL